MSLPRAIIFDLDDTLVESFGTPSAEMIASFVQLIQRLPVAIMTGAGFERTKRLFLEHLPDDANISRLFLFPDSSAQAYRHTESGWEKLYSKEFSVARRDEIAAIVEKRFAESGLKGEWDIVGEHIVIRDTQVTLAALGTGALREHKMAWDPTREKRERLRAVLAMDLPDCEVKIGGLTAVDVSPKGITKAYGILWFAKHLACSPAEMLYVGDSFGENGNDAAVIPTGIQWREVSGPEETLQILAEML